MISESDRELARARWRRALTAHALDQPDRIDFAQVGLARRLRSVTTQLVLLPADPESTAAVLDTELSKWLTDHRVVVIDDIGVQLASSPNIRPTAHALALVDGHEAKWSSYFAVHRSGALEFGMGDVGGWRERTMRASLFA